MNESIEKGSVLPFLEVAQKENLSVVIMNPNLNRDPKTNVISQYTITIQTVIPYNNSMTQHATFVWEHYVDPTDFNEIYVVAHSAGGACLAQIQKDFSMN